MVDETREKFDEFTFVFKKTKIEPRLDSRLSRAVHLALLLCSYRISLLT